MLLENQYLELAFKTIKSHYGDRVAKRSQVPLMNHITEGLLVLDVIEADFVTKAAFCLHPMLQSDEDFLAHRVNSIPASLIDAAILAMEYRRVANSYLSIHQASDFLGFTCLEVKEMLIADKVQNYKDFLRFHKATHERSAELDEYFNNWFLILGVNFEQIVNRVLQHTTL